MQRLQLICLHRVIIFLKYWYLGLSCNKKELATEGRPRTSRSICHGRTRKRHGRKQKQRHGRKKKQKHLPRINTEFHGKDRSKDTEGSRSSRSICHGLTRKRHGRKMRRQKKDWTSAYAKVTKAGAKSKGSNRWVAVGLPHRNSSVLKQAHIN